MVGGGRQLRGTTHAIRRKVRRLQQKKVWTLRNLAAEVGVDFTFLNRIELRKPEG
jgi:transcriptional regulator with XRE-family HTH domain